MPQPLEIIDALVTALRTLSLTPALNARTCYPIAAPAYIEGQEQLVLQVQPGMIAPDGAGKGSQEGGALERMMTVDVTIWMRLKLDSHARSEIAMMRATVSLMDVCNKVKMLLGLTYLKGLLTEPIWYLGESMTEVFDEDAGVYRRDMTFGCKWGERLPRTLTYS